jgi:hypothetical protein
MTEITYFGAAMPAGERDPASPLWTIITPTTGRPSLLRLKERLAAETTPYVHLVMFDAKRETSGLKPSEVEDERTFAYDIRHPTMPAPDSRMDVYLRGVGIAMARTPFIRCCDDDAWPEPNHLERVTAFMTGNTLDFCWCYRRMLTRAGEVIGIDRAEAIGHRNRFGYNLLDNSSLFYNQKAATVLMQIYLANPVYGDDRMTWGPLNAYCRGAALDEVLTNHMTQPELEPFFRKYCSPA